MQTLAIFIDSYPIKASPSILNIITALKGRYNITLFYRNIKVQFQYKEFQNEIKAVSIQPKKYLTWKQYLIYLRHTLWDFSILRKRNIVIDYLFLQTKTNSFLSMHNFFFSERKNYFKWKKISFELIICFDLEGLFLMKDILQIDKCKNIVFYSLELRLRDDITTHLLEKLARQQQTFNYVNKVIIQSEIRYFLLKQNFNIGVNTKHFILPVTYKGPPQVLKSVFYFDKFKIDSSKKICLHVGGIIPELKSIELALAFKDITDWVLIFQGYTDPNYLKKFNEVIEDRKIKNIYVSEIFTESPDDLAKLANSCNCGIAWYENSTENMRTAAESSGKIAMYLKCGLPVISNDYFSFKNLIEINQCGVCIANFEEIKNALNAVEENHLTMRKNAFALYERQFRFDKYLKPLLQYLDN